MMAPSNAKITRNYHNQEFLFLSFQSNCGAYGIDGNGVDYDFIHIPKPIIAAEMFGGQGELGASFPLCGNGNFCGRNTSGPGLCCRFRSFHLIIITAKKLAILQKWSVHIYL